MATWIKGSVLFPERAKMFRLSDVFLRKCDIIAPTELDEDVFTEWVEMVFAKVKELGYLPVDSQLVAAGLKQGYSAVFLTVDSSEFEPVKEGEKFPEEVLLFRDN